MYPNRYVCSVIDEMREQLKLLNVDSLPRFKNIQATLIEETQTMVNRMEASLQDNGDIIKSRDKRTKLRKQVRKLKRELEALESIKEDMTGEKVDKKEEKRLGGMSLAERLDMLGRDDD